ncbi:MAG TPA: zf-TFIIB domain-containing protein, partial [Planctomycetota bacterium]|nr:zf-TFIIB domain-containing protein [Planctomycetota bacterium]
PVKPLPGAAPGTPVLKGEDAIKAELEKVKRALKDLDGERRRLTSLAEKTERALLEEAQRRSQLEKKLESTGSGSQALEAKVSELRVLLEAKETEREELARKVAVLEKAAGTPSPQLVAELRAKAEAAAETKVRALTNERDGLKTRIKELESTSQGAGDKLRLEKLEEKLMELQIERDSFKERLTDAESQLANIPAGDVVERIKTSLADAERERDRYRDKVIDLEAQVAAIRGGLPIASTSSGRVNVMELQSRLEEAEREREKAERERDELEKRVHALKTDLYTRKKTPDSGDKHFCPGCGTEMRSVVNSSVHMAACPQCAGVYFAKGDVQAIVAQERELMKKAANGSFFSRIFGLNKP